MTEASLQSQVWLGNEPLEERRFGSVRNRLPERDYDGLPDKPARGGLWTSSYEENCVHGVDTICQWQEWCVLEKFGDYDRAYTLTPSESAEVLTIDSEDERQRVLREFGGEYYNDMYVWIDFEAAAEQFDGLRLTCEGRPATLRTSDHTFYGWDAESTLWFDWVFDAVERIEYPVEPQRARR